MDFKHLYLNFRNSVTYSKFFLLKFLLLAFFTIIQGFAYSQVNAPIDSLKADSLGVKGKKINQPAYDLSKQYDFGDLTRNITIYYRLQEIF